MARRDDAYHFRLFDNMHNEKQSPVFSQSEDSFTRFFVSSRIQKLHQRIEKNLTSLFEPDSVLGKIEARFSHIPAKALAYVEKIRVHV